MSIFQDIVSKAQSLFAPSKPDPAPVTPQNAPVQQSSIGGNGAVTKADKKPSSDPFSLSGLFGHLTDDLKMETTGIVSSPDDEAKQRKRDRDNKRSRVSNEILESEREKFKADPKNKDVTFLKDMSTLKRQTHGKMLYDDYNSKEQIGADKDKYYAEESQKPVGTLTTAEDRMKFLSKFTQNNVDLQDANGKDISEHACTPTSVIAAAIAMDGQGGLNPLINKMEKDLANDKSLKKSDRDSTRAVYALLKKKATENTLTMNDMVTLQGELYQSMHKQQMPGGKGKGDKSSDDGSISVNTVSNYLADVETSTDPQHKKSMLAKMDEQGLEIRGIDNDGDGTPNHAILAMNGAVAGGPDAHAIFDPYSRKGGQVVTAPEQLEDYYGTTGLGTLPKKPKSPFDGL